MGTIPKSSAMYLFRPNASYTCGECIFLKEVRDVPSGCALFGPTHKINALSGSCGYYSCGTPKKESLWLSVFTPKELGYAENRYGFSCKRCEYFGVGKNDCSRVDKHSPGDSFGEIAAGGCCSLWEADSKRARMTDTQLIQILAAKPKQAVTVPSLRAMMGAQ